MRARFARTGPRKTGSDATDTSFADIWSPRLVLRRLRRDDAATLSAYRSLPEVARYQSWDSFGPDDVARLIGEQYGPAPNVPGAWFQLAIVAAATEAMVGDCGLRPEGPSARRVHSA